jgi:hypothetical protein
LGRDDNGADDVACVVCNVRHTRTVDCDADGPREGSRGPDAVGGANAPISGESRNSRSGDVNCANKIIVCIADVDDARIVYCAAKWAIKRCVDPEAIRAAARSSAGAAAASERRDDLGGDADIPDDI